MHEIKLQLKDVYDLFATPQSDPFSPAWLDRAGLEYIADLLKTQRLPRKLKMIVQFSETPKYSEDDVQEAIARYSQAKIDDAKREMTEQRWQALKSLQTGLVVLLLALLGAASVNGAEFLPESVRALLSESLLIAGWVSMWHPAELILYAWWTPWRQIHIYERIQQMEVALEVTEPVFA